MNHSGKDLGTHNGNFDLFEKNSLHELGVSELWLVVIHAITSVRVSECLWAIHVLRDPSTVQRLLLASPDSFILFCGTN